MPRMARIVLPTYPHHVVQRGHNRNRQATFAEDADYERYLATLQAYKTEYRVSVFAWCLMTNHMHLLLAPEGRDGLGLNAAAAHCGKVDTNRAWCKAMPIGWHVAGTSNSIRYAHASLWRRTRTDGRVVSSGWVNRQARGSTRILSYLASLREPICRTHGVAAFFCVPPKAII